MCKDIGSRTTPTSQRGFNNFFGLDRQTSKPNASDINQMVSPSQASKQTRIDDAYTKFKKYYIGRAMSKWFYINWIPAHAANGTYYRVMVFKIQ